MQEPTNFKNFPYSRREFLRILSLATAAYPLRPILRQSAFFARRKVANPQKIIIIGAGLAGLTAGYELYKAGHQVIILEARTRPGGRVLTVREPFTDDLHAEAGGEWVEHNHEYVLRYVEEFGLSLYRGSFAENEQEALRYSPRERTVHEKIRALVKQVDPFKHDQPSLPEYDKISFRELLARLDAPPELIETMQRRISGLMAINIESISALHMLNEFALPESRASFRIAGGNDRLPRTLASQLRQQIYYARPVQKIEHSAEKVRVVFDENGHQQSMSADRVVIAAPFTCVRSILIEPALSGSKMKAIRTLGYGQILKASLQFRERFWLQEGRMMRKSLPGIIGSVYAASGGQRGPRGLLTAYIPDKSGMKIGALPPAIRLAEIKKKLFELYPEAAHLWEAAFVKWWREDRWAQGTYAYFRPGEITTLRPILAKPEGRIHFAGEHTAYWQGYMNGAVESGHRVAKEIADLS